MKTPISKSVNELVQELDKETRELRKVEAELKAEKQKNTGEYKSLQVLANELRMAMFWRLEAIKERGLV